MKASFVRLSEMLLVVAPLTVILFGCVGYDDGYGYGGAAVAGPGYYEPYGAYYGGWAPGYYVAPYRNGYFGGSRRGGVSHAYRTAPASHGAPSIPSASRSGGSRSR